MKKLIIIGILAFLLIPGWAFALTYDFNALDDERTYSESEFNGSLTPGGFVIFLGGTQFRASSEAIAPGISDIAIFTYYAGTTNAGETRATFINPTDSVSITFGDYGQTSGGDIDNIYLYAYDSSNTLIGQAGYSILGNSFESHTLSVSAANANIDHVLFGSTGSIPNSVFWDNFTFNENAGNGGNGGEAVPEPATMLLLGTGLLGLVGFSRRKRRS